MLDYNLIRSYIIEKGKAEYKKEKTNVNRKTDSDLTFGELAYTYIAVTHA